MRLLWRWTCVSLSLSVLLPACLEAGMINTKKKILSYLQPATVGRLVRCSVTCSLARSLDGLMHSAEIDRSMAVRIV